jgi:hypothetical protein
MKHCKNCGSSLHGLYCSHCGQKASTGRITFSYLLHEVFHFFSHIEKGFVFTSLHLIYEPAKTVKNFVDGKRKNHQPPISYFIIWTTIYILFLYWLEKLFGENNVINYKEYFGPGTTTKFAISHLSLVLTIVIPFQALYLYILVTRNTFNFFESMVAAIYSLGTIILFQFLFAVIALLVHLISSKSVDLRISDLFKILYLSWFIFDLTRQFSIKSKVLKAILFLILAFGTFTLWRLYGFPAIARLFT